jgi:hypothetical protein
MPPVKSTVDDHKDEQAKEHKDEQAKHAAKPGDLVTHAGDPAGTHFLVIREDDDGVLVAPVETLRIPRSAVEQV